MNQEFDLGIKTKICIILLILFPTILTSIILSSNDTTIITKTLSLLGTIIISYVTAIIIQDYIYVKKRSDKTQCRHDVYLIEPLFERLNDKNV